LLSAPLKLSDNRIFTESFENWIRPRATVVPFPVEGLVDVVLSQLEHQMKTLKYAAVVLEPVQGRGGDRAFPVEFLRKVAGLAKKYRVLIIFDEIFSGLGRTGKMFAFEHSQVVPDIICLGKALGGGLPLSACAGDILDVWGRQTDGEARHTSTFLGHPLACATGAAAIKEIKKRLPEFKNTLRQVDREFDKFSLPVELKKTGLGFMRGLHFPGRRGFGAHLMFSLLEEGFLVIPSGRNGEVLSLTPPLIAKAEDFRKLFAVLKKLIRA
jgi:acetylornithine/succinyldiaminopimelate/putrescine aminotransferase